MCHKISQLLTDHLKRLKCCLVFFLRQIERFNPDTFRICPRKKTIDIILHNNPISRMPSAIKLVSLPHGLPIVCPHTQAYHHVRPDTAQIKYPISGMFTNVIQLWNADRQHCLAVYLELCLKINLMTFQNMWKDQPKPRKSIPLIKNTFLSLHI